MSEKKKIIIGSDHAGFEMKNSIISNLSDIEFDDIGTDSDESVDYPDYANELVKRIQSNSYSFGILICGTGIGMSMSANRTKDIRAALCLNTKMAELARQHNDANYSTVDFERIFIELGDIKMQKRYYQRSQRGRPRPCKSP